MSDSEDSGVVVPVVRARRNVRAAAVPLTTHATTVKKGILVAIVQGSTYNAPTADQQNSVGMIRDCITAAEAHFQSTPAKYKNEELRIFMAPEWYFRKPGPKERTSTPYTHAEMRQIVDDLLAISAEDEFQNWVILPGTIYFGLEYTDYVDLTEPSSIAARAQDVIDYFKLPTAADTDAPIRPAPNLITGRFKKNKKIKQWVVGNLGIVAHRGNLLNYHFKWIQQDIAVGDSSGSKPNHVWATNLLTFDEAKLVTRSGCFEIPCDDNLYGSRTSFTCTYDICRDHKIGIGMARCEEKTTDPKLVDIHFLISNGISPFKASISARKGGHFLYCDGEGAKAVAKQVTTPAPVPIKDDHWEDIEHVHGVDIFLHHPDADERAEAPDERRKVNELIADLESQYILSKNSRKALDAAYSRRQTISDKGGDYSETDEWKANIAEQHRLESEKTWSAKVTEKLRRAKQKKQDLTDEFDTYSARLTDAVSTTAFAANYDGSTYDDKDSNELKPTSLLPVDHGGRTTTLTVFGGKIKVKRT